jgi:glycosyltransferase involved in cell wall biosynthesis
MNSPNYTVRHFDLASKNVFPGATVTGAQYCVFWYKSIPLGEKYFESSTELTAEQFCNICWSAVRSTMKHHYGRNCNGVFPKSVASIEEIQNICHGMLSELIPSDCPDYCDVTVVVCTRNRPALLKSCLEKLSCQVTQPAEIIVIDNASDTEQTRTVTEEFSGVRYIREDKLGLDIARNRGALEAKCSVVAYTDDDTTPNPYWVYRINETFQNPTIAAMTGLVIAASLGSEAEVIFEKYWPFNRGYVNKLYDNNFFSSTLESGPPVWKIGAGANMAFRKNVFEEVGYFDERLDVGAAGCNGDSELWYRILANGFSILYNPLAVVSHSHRNSIQALKKQLFGYMRGFTVAILIQYYRFGHPGNIRQLIKVFPFYYLSLLGRGFPFYRSKYQTIFSEMAGVISGLFYYWRNRKGGPKSELGWQH